MNFRHYCGAIAASLLGLATLSSTASAQFTDKATTTPVLIQDGFGPQGSFLPSDGGAYCFPTAASMSLLYLGINGYNQIGPSNPTAANELNMVSVLGGLMGTNQFTGIGSSPGADAGVQLYLAAKGIGTTNYTLNAIASPTVAQLAAANTNTSATYLGFGFYDVTSGDRTGGHASTLISQNATMSGTSAGTILVNNPSPSTFLPVADLPANGQQNLNLVATPANLAGHDSIMIDPATNTSSTSGNIRTVLESASTLTINFSQQSANNPTPATWTMNSSTDTPQSIGLNNGYLSVLAPIAGTAGISKGGGMLEMFAPDNSTGTNYAISGIWQSDVASGKPFGIGSMHLHNGIVQFTPGDVGNAVTLVLANGSGNGLALDYNGTIGLNANGNPSLTVFVGGHTDGTTPNIARESGYTGGTLVIAPASGMAGLGATERLIVDGSAGNLPALTNGIVNTMIVGRDNDANGSGDFLTYSTNGFSKATYVTSGTTGLAAAGSTAVYQADANQTLASGTTAQVYALKVGNGVSIVGAGGTTTLQVGSQASGVQSGLILNGGTIGTTNLNVGASEGTIYTSNAGGAISSVVQGSGGITTFGTGNLTLTGANTYTGTTTINSGILIAANTTGSATGHSDVIVRETGILQINAGATAGYSGGTTSVPGGGGMMLNGGTLAGTLSLTGVLGGRGTLTGNATVTNADIAAVVSHDPVTQLVGIAPTATAVNNITFSGNNVSMTDVNYNWQINALNDNPANAGVNWSLLRVTTNTTNSSNIAQFGTQADPVYVSLGFGIGLPDPNSGNAFWNQPHSWVIAQEPYGFNGLWDFERFQGFSQGFFSLSNDASLANLYVNFTPAFSPQTTWTGDADGSWNNSANWAPAAVPAGGPNTQLVFGASNNPAMTNDIPATFTLNSLTFNSGAPVYTLAGNGLVFVTNGNGAPPQIVSNSSNSVTIGVPLTLANNLTVSGSGNVTLSGMIGGAGSLTMNGTGILVLNNIGNTFSGGTNVLSGTVQIPADAALGTGPLTFAATGTLA